jgi:hypothetical protein
MRAKSNLSFSRRTYKIPDDTTVVCPCAGGEAVTAAGLMRRFYHKNFPDFPDDEIEAKLWEWASPQGEA